MFLKDIDPTKLALLTPNQLKVVERWDREAQERSKLIPATCAAYNSGDYELAHKLGKQLLDMDAEYCEHGRHKYSARCMGCEEIEQILFPELSENE